MLIQWHTVTDHPGIRQQLTGTKRSACAMGRRRSKSSWSRKLVSRELELGKVSACLFAHDSLSVEIVMHKEYVCLYRNVSDVHLVIIGDLAENELLLLELMNTLYTSLASITG